MLRSRTNGLDWRRRNQQANYESQAHLPIAADRLQGVAAAALPVNADHRRS